MRNESLKGLAQGLLEKGHSKNEVRKYLVRHNFNPRDIDAVLKHLHPHLRRHHKLVSYVHKQKNKGHSYESIRHHLMKHGVSHEDTHKAIGHAISHPKKKSNIYLALSAISIVFGLLFIFPFLPPIGLLLALVSIIKSKDRRTRKIAIVGLVVCFLSIFLIAYLFLERGHRTGLATAILPAISHDEIKIFQGESKKAFIYIPNNGYEPVIYKVMDFRCRPSCEDITITYQETGIIESNNYFALPLKISSEQNSEIRDFKLMYSIKVGALEDNGEFLISILPSS
ncbi:hypothetical protein ACFLZX_03620 [Nanoarchaeota archaeon]